MRALLVKMSSLGDVVHALPAVTDAAAVGVRFDWVVEEGFADIAVMHPAVERVIPIAWRKWRKALFASDGTARQALADFYTELRAAQYDVVLDSQGLIKSAVVTALSRGARNGFSHTVAREPWSAFAYGVRHCVPTGQHAIDRQRQLFAATFGYELSQEPFSGIEQNGTRKREVVLLHGTTWETKHYPETMWCALAQSIVAYGYTPVVTWGNAEEQARAGRIADMPGVRRLERQPLADLARQLAGAALVIGVDSGLTHLSAALGTPTLGIYGPTDAHLTGCRGARTAVVQATTDCSPCVEKACRRYSGAAVEFAGTVVEPPCFGTLLPDQIWRTAQALL